MSKHTPGPWIVICPDSRRFHEGKDITHYEVMTDKTRNELRKGGFNHYLDDPRNVDNVSIVSMHFWRDMTTEEANANANLIAAAPELLEALIRLLPMAEDDAFQYGGNPNNDDDITFARAAIYKAAGWQK